MNINKNIQPLVDRKTATNIISIKYLANSVNISLNLCNDSDQTLFFNAFLFLRREMSMKKGS